MSELTVRQICSSMKLWLFVKLLPFSAYVVLFVIGRLLGHQFPISIAVLCALYSAFSLWRGLMRIGRIKRRDFAWCEGVTVRVLGKYSKGNVLINTGYDNVKAYGHPAGMFYLRSGIPVYIVALNIRETAFLKGGFTFDPTAFKKKDKYQ